MSSQSSHRGIDLRLLNEFPEFQEFRRGRENGTASAESKLSTSLEATPEEALDAAYKEIRASLV